VLDSRYCEELQELLGFLNPAPKKEITTSSPISGKKWIPLRFPASGRHILGPKLLQLQNR